MKSSAQTIKPAERAYESFANSKWLDMNATSLHARETKGWIPGALREPDPISRGILLGPIPIAAHCVKTLQFGPRPVRFGWADK